MGHSVWIQIRLSSSQVMFRLSDISGRFGLDQVWFDLGRFRINQFLVKYVRHAKTSNFVEDFGSGMARFGSIRVLSSLPSEHISDIGSSMGSVVRFEFWVSGQF